MAADAAAQTPVTVPRAKVAEWQGYELTWRSYDGGTRRATATLYGNAGRDADERPYTVVLVQGTGNPAPVTEDAVYLAEIVGRDLGVDPHPPRLPLPLRDRGRRPALDRPRHRPAFVVGRADLAEMARALARRGRGLHRPPAPVAVGLYLASRPSLRRYISYSPPNNSLARCPRPKPSAPDSRRTRGRPPRPSPTSPASSGRSPETSCPPTDPTGVPAPSRAPGRGRAPRSRRPRPRDGPHPDGRARGVPQDAGHAELAAALAGQVGRAYGFLHRAVEAG